MFVAEAEGDPALCPVKALLRLRDLFGGGEPVFTVEAGGGRIKKNTIGARLKKV